MSNFDVILVQPYPHTDHPSFPDGLLKRWLEHHGFSVGVIETPRWHSAEDFKKLGPPRLFFGIVSGPLDSIVLNYTSLRKRRNEDLYQFDRRAYFPDMPPSVSSRIRPDRTVIVYANRLREAFREIPIVIGGMEASMRRFTHYDFQQDKIRRSVLFDSRADLLVAGMGEMQIQQIASGLAAGNDIGSMQVPGTAVICPADAVDPGVVTLTSHEAVLADPSKLVDLQLSLERAMNRRQTVFQPHEKRGVLAFPPQAITSGDMDKIYGLPFDRSHPGRSGLTPALQMNLFSVTSHRGCGGHCSFCSIQGHQGKRVISRSAASIFREIVSFRKHRNWRGVVSDIGGATAEMYGIDCHRTCQRLSCLYPETCPHFRSPSAYLEILRKVREMPGVKQVMVGSGLRFDILEKHPQLLEELMRFHAGKYLRIAPEHTEDHILKRMNKPPFERLESFVRLFDRINDRLKRKVALGIYLITGFPGETHEDVIQMRDKLRSLRLTELSIQVFTPSPGTMGTAMYVGEMDPGGGGIPVEKNMKILEKRKNMLIRSR